MCICMCDELVRMYVLFARRPSWRADADRLFFTHGVYMFNEFARPAWPALGLTWGRAELTWGRAGLTWGRAELLDEFVRRFWR